MLNLKRPSITQLCAVFAILQGVLAAQVCTQEGCIKGKSSSSMLYTDRSSRNYLTPGTYPLYDDLALSQSSLSAPLNQTTWRNGESITLTYPSRPAVFDQAVYRGSVQSFSGLDWRADEGWKSLYLPQDWYAVTGDGEVLWGPVVDAGQLPSGVKTRISKASSSVCDPSCSSGGLCIPSRSASNTAICQCRPGWAGSQCEQCAPGFFGSTCKACDAACTVCDGGLSGTGKCLGTAKDASACNCAHGTCTTSGDCTCSAGFSTNTTTSDKKCNTCIPGFFQTGTGNCRSCPAGCSTCRLKDGTANTAICTSCRPNLTLNTADPARCVSRGSCIDGQYWDTSTTSCSLCSPACSTCSGPSPSDCLSCAPPRMNLEGQCVGLDSKGVCDSSLASVQGVFIANNEIGKCDACPSGCTACNIPSFSSVSTFASLQCSACADGYLLENGKCVKRCSAGWFLPGSADRTGTCQQCSSTCAECQTTSTSCTRCPLGTTFALSGLCVPTCPSGTIGLNSTCTPCHPSCSTCSSPSSSSCLTCPSTLPVLRSGICTDHCPRSSYFDPTSKSCLGCDWTCASCSSAGDGSCTSCADGYVLQGGKCKSVQCGQGGFVHGSGACLGDFVDKEDKRWIAGPAVGAVLVLVAIGASWYIRKQRKRTREQSQAFREAMEQQGPGSEPAKRRLAMGMGVGKLFGKDRVWTGRSGGGEAGVAGRGEGERKRLRELLLPSHRARSAATAATGEKRGDIELAQTKYQEAFPLATPGRQSAYLNPPPPYDPTPSSSARASTVLSSNHLLPLSSSHFRPPSPSYSYSGSSTPLPTNATSTGPGPSRPYENARAHLLRTLQHHEDDVDLLSSSQQIDFFLPLIPAPPRAMTAAIAKGKEEEEREVYRPQLVPNWRAGERAAEGQGTDEEEVRRLERFETRLSELWPDMGSQKRERIGEGWV